MHGGFEPCGSEAGEFAAHCLAEQQVAIYRPEAPTHDVFDRLLGAVVRVRDAAGQDIPLGGWPLTDEAGPRHRG